MELIKKGIDILLHLDKYLSVIIQTYGTGTYLILFILIFAETGFVVTPFLPGDSLLFAAGAFAALGALDVKLLFLIIAVAAILGDTVNYSIGKTIGNKVYQMNNRFIKREYIEKTNNFFDKYGNVTIIIARFIPIVRTFAPFVAGVGEMKYLRFISYNIVGGLTWVALFIFGGYFFGNLPSVKENFSIVIFAIIFISVLPAVIGILKSKMNSGAKE